MQRNWDHKNTIHQTPLPMQTIHMPGLPRQTEITDHVPGWAMGTQTNKGRNKDKMNPLKKIYYKIKSSWDSYWAEQDITYMGEEYPDAMWGIHTGRFHYIKRFVSPLLSPHIRKMQIAVDTHYDKTLSTNSKVFKKIIAEMEEKDNDPGTSAADALGFTRKSFYIFCMKFMITLYDFDTHYMERGDFVIRRLIEEQHNLYYDAQSNPENWYPDRKPMIYGKYLIMRNREVKQP